MPVVLARSLVVDSSVAGLLCPREPLMLTAGTNHLAVSKVDVERSLCVSLKGGRNCARKPSVIKDQVTYL